MSSSNDKNNTHGPPQTPQAASAPTGLGALAAAAAAVVSSSWNSVARRQTATNMNDDAAPGITSAQQQTTSPPAAKKKPPPKKKKAPSKKKAPPKRKTKDKRSGSNNSDDKNKKQKVSDAAAAAAEAQELAEQANKKYADVQSDAKASAAKAKAAKAAATKAAKVAKKAADDLKAQEAARAAADAKKAQEAKEKADAVKKAQDAARDKRYQTRLTAAVAAAAAAPPAAAAAPAAAATEKNISAKREPIYLAVGIPDLSGILSPIWLPRKVQEQIMAKTKGGYLFRDAHKSDDMTNAASPNPEQKLWYNKSLDRYEYPLGSIMQYSLHFSRRVEMRAQDTLDTSQGPLVFHYTPDKLTYEELRKRNARSTKGDWELGYEYKDRDKSKDDKGWVRMGDWDNDDPHGPQVCLGSVHGFPTTLRRRWLTECGRYETPGNASDAWKDFADEAKAIANIIQGNDDAKMTIVDAPPVNDFQLRIDDTPANKVDVATHIFRLWMASFSKPENYFMPTARMMVNWAWRYKRWQTNVEFWDTFLNKVVKAKRPKPVYAFVYAMHVLDTDPRHWYILFCQVGPNSPPVWSCDEFYTTKAAGEMESLAENISCCLRPKLTYGEAAPEGLCGWVSLIPGLHVRGQPTTHLAATVQQKMVSRCYMFAGLNMAPLIDPTAGVVPGHEEIDLPYVNRQSTVLLWLINKYKADVNTRTMGAMDMLGWNELLMKVNTNGKKA